MPRKIIIDTDPGCDDAIAMMMAFAAPTLEVSGICTTYGNAPLAQTTVNALKICELAGQAGTGVYPGCEMPFLHPLETAEMVHGRDAMAELDLPVPAILPQGVHAADFIVETLMREPAGTVTLCTLGPLTNVALAMIKQRGIVPRIAEIVIMGGTFFAGGNVTTSPAAETNIYCDPHAARVVFESGVKLTLAPLDLTHQNLATPARIAACRGVDSAKMRIVADILEFYSRFDVEKMGLPGGPIHDPCVIAWLVAPHLFQEKDVFVEVEAESRKTIGMTVFDWWGSTGRAPNATVLHSLDSDGFYSLMTDMLSRP